VAEGRKASAAQIAANRENARRSTGPRTAEGKARSAQNATRHGSYARELHPMMVGPLAEDPDEFYERAEELIASFEPRGALELELAKRATSALMRMKRLDAYEAAMDDITAKPDQAVTVLYGDLQEAEGLMWQAEFLVEFIEAKADDRLESLDWVDYEDLARRVRGYSGPVSIPGVWDDDAVPTTEEGWSAVLDALLEHHSMDGDGGLRWAKEVHHVLRLRHFMIEHQSKGLLARRLIKSGTDTTERPRAALWREFNNAMRQLLDVRKVFGEVDQPG
jgi:hypothetical protein